MTGGPGTRRSSSAPVLALAGARAAYGLAQLAVPRRLARAWDVSPTPPTCVVLRVLGGRHLLQALTMYAVQVRADGTAPGQRWPRLAGVAGAVVDLTHAATMVGVAASSPAWRQAALFDGTVAAGLASAELAAADGARTLRDAEAGTAREDRVLRSGTTSGDVQPTGPTDGSEPTMIAAPPEEGEEALRRRLDAELQEIVRELAGRSKGRAVAEVMTDLQQTLDAHRLGHQPATWLDAVAREASTGRTYVLSTVAARDTGIEEPEPGPRGYGVS